MSVKLGTLDISGFKVGSADCKVYLGETLIYSGGTPPSPQWVTYQSGDTIPNVQFYGVRVNTNVVHMDEEISSYYNMTFSNTITLVGVASSGYWGCNYNGSWNGLTPDANGYVTIIFSDYDSGDMYLSWGSPRFECDLLQMV